MRDDTLAIVVLGMTALVIVYVVYMQHQQQQVMVGYNAQGRVVGYDGAGRLVTGA